MKFVKISQKELKEMATFYQGVMATAYEGLFYREGKVIGKSILEVITESESILQKCSKLIEARGWVDEVILEDEKAFTQGSVEVNTDAVSPTCHRLRGILAAVYEKENGGLVEVKEIRCESLGDDHCEFEIDKGIF